MTQPGACSALFDGKADDQKCSQITCSKALGVTMKLVCSGGCCPTCWAPDHIVKLDRHTTIERICRGSKCKGAKTLCRCQMLHSDLCTWNDRRLCRRSLLHVLRGTLMTLEIDLKNDR